MAIEIKWNDKDPETGERRYLRAEKFAGKWRFNRTVRALAGSPLAMRVASRAATLAPSLIERTIQYAGDAVA